MTSQEQAVEQFREFAENNLSESVSVGLLPASGGVAMQIVAGVREFTSLNRQTRLVCVVLDVLSKFKSQNKAYGGLCELAALCDSAAWCLPIVDVQAKEPAFVGKDGEFWMGKITYPIAYDLELESQYKLGKAVCTAMCKSFMDTIAAYNYQPMLYTNINWICCHLNYDELKDYPLWLAAYISETKVKKYIGKYDMWQHSVAGHKFYDIQKVGAVSGIIGQCDCNWGYSGFAAQIRKNGKNKLPESKYRVTGTKVVTKSNLAPTTGPLQAMGFTIKTEEI